MAIEAYCVKCKAKKIMQDPVEGTTKNGKPITKGKCQVLRGGSLGSKLTLAMIRWQKMLPRV